MKKRAKTDIYETMDVLSGFLPGKLVKDQLYLQDVTYSREELYHGALVCVLFEGLDRYESTRIESAAAGRKLVACLEPLYDEIMRKGVIPYQGEVLYFNPQRLLLFFPGRGIPYGSERKAIDDPRFAILRGITASKKIEAVLGRKKRISVAGESLILSCRVGAHVGFVGFNTIGAVKEGRLFYVAASGDLRFADKLTKIKHMRGVLVSTEVHELFRREIVAKRGEGGVYEIIELRSVAKPTASPSVTFSDFTPKTLRRTAKNLMRYLPADLSREIAGGKKITSVGKSSQGAVLVIRGNFSSRGDSTLTLDRINESLKNLVGKITSENLEGELFSIEDSPDGFLITIRFEEDGRSVFHKLFSFIEKISPVYLEGGEFSIGAMTGLLFKGVGGTFHRKESFLYGFPRFHAMSLSKSAKPGEVLYAGVLKDPLPPNWTFKKARVLGRSKAEKLIDVYKAEFKVKN